MWSPVVSQSNKYCTNCGALLSDSSNENVNSKYAPNNNSNDTNSSVTVGSQSNNATINNSSYKTPDTSGSSTYNKTNNYENGTKPLVVNEYAKSQVKTFASWTKFVSITMIIFIILATIGLMSQYLSVKGMMIPRALHTQLNISFITSMITLLLGLFVYGKACGAASKFQEAIAINDERCIGEAFSKLKTIAIIAGVILIIVLLLILFAIIGGLNVKRFY